MLQSARLTPQTIIETIRKKQKNKDALLDRRSQASGARLKNVVSLIDGDDGDGGASAGTAARKKKVPKKEAAAAAAAAAEDDGFGDDDAGWLIYRQIVRARSGRGCNWT